MKYIVKSQIGEVVAGLYAPISTFESAASYANAVVFSAQFPDITEATVVEVDAYGSERVVYTREAA